MSFDTVLTGATLLTGDPDRPVIADGALGLRKIGSLSSARARTCRRTWTPAWSISPGRLISPGFVNVHTHAVLSLMRGIAHRHGLRAGLHARRPARPRHRS